MKITLQVERHVVAVETDCKASDSYGLFKILLDEVVKKMDWVLKGQGGEQ